MIRGRSRDRGGKVTNTVFSDLNDIVGIDYYYKTNDAASITSSGGLVSQITNKDGGTAAVQATGTLQPTTGTRTINTVNAFDFIPTDYLTIAGDLTASNQMSFGFVINPDGFTSVTRHIWDQSPGSNAGMGLRFSVTTGILTWFSFVDTGSLTLTGGSGLSAGTSYLVAGRMKSGQIELFVNGGAAYASASTAFSSIVDAAASIAIGGRVEGDQVYDGLIGSWFFASQTFLDNYNMNLAMGKLATDFGLTWSSL